MKTMTSAEIRNRINEIKQMQDKHQKRNFDAELLEVMNAGGDVDSLEQKQLDDERVARRLRVEKQALEAQLPKVIYAEDQGELEGLKNSCKHDAILIAEQVDIIEQAFNETIKPALEVLEEIRIKRFNALRRADIIQSTHKLGGNNHAHFGQLDSRRLSQIKVHVSSGRDLEDSFIGVTNGKFIEDLILDGEG
ncbi:hypothetical protein [Vibrio metschnikovii]|uniref:hypothetical protein n=1 Tax=Vibrio metschnikovii TaxID=28172 RepID=UPI00164C531B|nr:hypothetical protein [Vibrio metschnikovii]MBC5831906.1 hypothetical protein [Vibrio metschnikovii]